MSRSIQSKSSGRVIIVDVTTPSESTCEHLTQALKEFVLINNSLPGTPRVQLLSVYLLGQTTECLVQLQYVKTNLQKIIQSINDMVETECINKGGREHFEDYLNSILMETLIQFKQLHRTSDKLVSSTPQLDICLITSQRRGPIEQKAAKVLKDSDMSLIKKLQLVHIANTSFSNENNDLPSSDDSTGSVDSGTNDILCGYVESLFIENNALSYEQFFKTWLQDIGSDEVHLFIEFNQEDEDGFAIKCDLHDVIVNPLNITGGQYLVLQTETDISPLNITFSAKSKSVSKLSVYTLRPKTFVKLANVCESVLYGFPRVLRPTSCWKLDWEELEKNQCYFAGIRTYLFEEELCLLLVDLNQPITAHYLLLPSSDSTMLIKSIAIRDLMMPLDASVTISNIKEEITAEVVNQMKKISVSESFNPFKYSCGLFNRVLSNSVKPNNTKQSTTKSSTKKKPANQSSSKTPLLYSSNQSSASKRSSSYSSNQSSSSKTPLYSSNQSPVSKATSSYSKTTSYSSNQCSETSSPWSTKQSIDFDIGVTKVVPSRNYSSVVSNTVPDRASSKTPIGISTGRSFSATKKATEASENVVFQKFSLMPSALQDEPSIEPVPIVPTYELLPTSSSSSVGKYIPRFNARSKQPSNLYSSNDGVSAAKKRK